MSDTNTGAESNKGNGNAAADADAEAEVRTVRRKPIWVCVPIEFEEIAVENEDGKLVAERQATKYAITRCEPKKKDVLAVLALHEIDISSIDTVLMFRADPMQFGVSNQLSIKW